MNDAAERPLWLADPSVEWRILLTARLPRPAAAEEVVSRLTALNRRLGSTGTTSPLVDHADHADHAPGGLLHAVVAAPGAPPVSAGLDGPDIAVAGEHQYVDGLGMLAVLAELTGVPARSSARGLGPRAQPPFVLEVSRRLTEVALRPPARVAPTAGGAGGDVPHGSSYADLPLDRRVGVTDLVHAAARAVAVGNRHRGGRARRVVVAIGASTLGGAASGISENSALLRLRSAERADRDAIRHFLGTAPTVPSPGRSLDGSASWVTRAARVGVRVLGPRLGSTLTVSHLGDVTAEVEEMAFYPVAGGASAVALGAVTLDGRTRITARGRADRHSRAGLESLLALVAEHVA